MPGAAHLFLGRRKGVVFLVVLPAMFAFGLLLQGRIFPIDFSQPLVALAALADVAIGAPFFIARGLGYGVGTVIAVAFLGAVSRVTVDLGDTTVLAQLPTSAASQHPAGTKVRLALRTDPVLIQREEAVPAAS